MTHQTTVTCEESHTWWGNTILMKNRHKYCHHIQFYYYSFVFHVFSYFNKRMKVIGQPQRRWVGFLEMKRNGYKKAHEILI